MFPVRHSRAQWAVLCGRDLSACTSWPGGKHAVGILSQVATELPVQVFALNFQQCTHQFQCCWKIWNFSDTESILKYGLPSKESCSQHQVPKTKIISKLECAACFLLVSSAGLLTPWHVYLHRSWGIEWLLSKIGGQDHIELLYFEQVSCAALWLLIFLTE